MPAPAPARPPGPPSAPAATDWRDAPATPGDWQWSETPIGASASFANGQFVMTCNRASATISLLRTDTSAAAGAPTITITASDDSRTTAATHVAGGIGVSLPARDRLLDAMAVSRGRFALAATGTPTLYIPSWTEVSRVIEDCR